jgi:choline dehydrogenase
MSRDDDAYDFIITGAGSAGCAVAARLSESGRYRVLLLEAGGKDHNIWIHIPLGYTKTFTDRSVNWMFDSEPEKALNNRVMYQPRGKVLGGTSSINGMIYMRGNHADYDDWRQRGCTGWDWESVLPYFKKAEDQARGPSEYHGIGGPLRVSDQPQRWELADALLEACVQAGIPRNGDFNGPRQDGVGYYQTTTSHARRWSTAVGYLQPARKRTNFTIVTDAHATALLFEGARAVGVQYQTPAGRKIARARREIVISGGVYGSPQLLLLSGIGPADHLQDMGIPVLRDLPVGNNLHDHFNTYLTYRCSKPITLNELQHSLGRRVRAAMEYALFRKGPMSGNGLYVGAFFCSDERFERPDMQMNMFAWSTVERTRKGIVSHPFPGFSLSPVHLRPEGRGAVRLKTPDPMAPPEIRFNFLQSEYDYQALLSGIRMARKIAAQPALKPYIVEETLPGPACQTDAELIKDIRARGVSNLHPVGTCRMGIGPDAVVDPRLRVYGVAGLRVADASVMPQIVAGNTNAPSIMIGEKCASMVLEDAANNAGSWRP